MRRSRLLVVAIALVLSCVAFADAAGAAAAGTPRPGRRSWLMSRKGAEIWGEVPRLALPVEHGYSGRYAIDDGWGFGFGVMFGVSDRLLVEARMLQTGHLAQTTGEEWDLDQTLVGARYLLKTDDNFQPYIGLGGARLALEWNPDDGNPNDFARLTGYGGYASAGIDYIVSSRWVVGVRTDFVLMNYTTSLIGATEGDVNLRGDVLAFSASLSYRVPVWW
jgi:opacity protein-like surface antigen